MSLLTPPIMELEHLDCALPDFLRLAWINEPAREIWSGRFQRTLRAWAEIEWLSVAAGIRDCALARIPRREYEAFMKKLELHGLTARPADSEPASSNSPEAASQHPSASPKASLRLVIGQVQHIALFQKALNSAGHEEIGKLLGYPACCTKAFRERCPGDIFSDPTWKTAAETVPTEVPASVIELNEEPVANVLLRWIGIRAIPHLPCRFDCKPSIQFGRRFLNLGLNSGFQAEMEWLEHTLSWPIEWSALHGIAEVKTPVLKISTKTEATTNKLTVRWKGSQYPDEGAQGVSFPYKTPQRPLMTGSPSFQRALEQQLDVVRITPAEGPSG